MGVEFPEKKRYVTLEWPLCGEVCQYTIGMETMFASVESSLNCLPDGTTSIQFKKST